MSFCSKKDKKKEREPEYFSLGESRKIGERLTYRGYRRRKIVCTFKVTRVSRSFKRLSRLTLSPGQFKLLDNLNCSMRWSFYMGKKWCVK